MPDLVYLDGQFLPADEAKISVFDHGFLYGDGLFETMRSYRGRIFLLAEHLDRLENSAKAIALRLPFDRTAIHKVLGKLIELNGENLYIRLTVSRGPGPVGIDPGLCPTPTVLITSKPISYNELLYSKGAKAVFVKTLRNLAGATMPEVKSLNFLNNILAKREVIEAGADEGFMTNYREEIAEGTVSNVFLIKNGCLKTPAPSTGLLRGITRQRILEIGAGSGIPVEERILYKKDFYEADEIFFTNSGSEVVPVTNLDGCDIGAGIPGEITLKLLKAYRNQAWNKQLW